MQTKERAASMMEAALFSILLREQIRRHRAGLLGVDGESPTGGGSIDRGS